MKRIFTAILAAICMIFCTVSLTCCNKGVNYSKDNSYQVEVETLEDGTMVFSPKGVKPKLGLLFYVATITEPKYYEFLARPLASQGYLVAIPNALFAYFQYSSNEQVFERYKDVKFYVGGHSQGGGAALRRAEENIDRVKGLILFAPLCLSHSAVDEEGFPVNHIDSVKDFSLPTLLLEAEIDGVLNDSMKADTLTRLNLDTTEIHVLKDARHMGFSSFDELDPSALFGAMGGIFSGGTIEVEDITPQQKGAQRSLTVDCVLNFLKSHS